MQHARVARPHDGHAAVQSDRWIDSRELAGLRAGVLFGLGAVAVPLRIPDCLLYYCPVLHALPARITTLSLRQGRYSSGEDLPRCAESRIPR